MDLEFFGIFFFFLYLYYYTFVFRTKDWFPFKKVDSVGTGQSLVIRYCTV